MMKIRMDNGKKAVTGSGKCWLCVAMALIALFAVMYISLIFNKSIWIDEAYTMEMVRENDFLGIIKTTAKDVHPPLYYLMAECFTAVLGDTFWVYKLLSIIPMVLTMLFAFSHIKPWWGERAAVLFIIMINAIPCVLEYVVQMRMYSWAMFFVTWAGLSAYGMYKDEDIKRFCIQLAASSIFACYTHNYAMISCVCIYIIMGMPVFLKCKKSGKWLLLKSWFISGAAVAALYLPWLFVLIKQTSDRIENYWIEPVTMGVIPEYFEFLFSSELPYSTAMYLILCAAAVATCIIKRESSGLLALAVPVMTAAIGITVSILVSPFFVGRYLIPCAGLLALFIALAFCEKPGAFQVALAVFGILMTLVSYKKNYMLEYKSTHVEELLSYMEENLAPDDLIAYNYEGFGFVYEIYFYDRVKFLRDVDFSGDFGSIWYFDSCVTPWLDGQLLEQNGLEKEFIMTTGIEHNEFQLYQIRHKK